MIHIFFFSKSYVKHDKKYNFIECNFATIWQSLVNLLKQKHSKSLEFNKIRIIYNEEQRIISKWN